MTTPIPEVTTHPNLDRKGLELTIERLTAIRDRLVAENEELKRQLATMRQSRDYHYSVRRNAEPY